MSNQTAIKAQNHPEGYPIAGYVHEHFVFCKVSVWGKTVKEVPETDYIFAEPIELNKICEIEDYWTEEQRQAMIKSIMEFEI